MSCCCGQVVAHSVARTRCETRMVGAKQQSVIFLILRTQIGRCRRWSAGSLNATAQGHRLAEWLRLSVLHGHDVIVTSHSRRNQSCCVPNARNRCTRYDAAAVLSEAHTHAAAASTPTRVSGRIRERRVFPPFPRFHSAARRFLAVARPRETVCSPSALRDTGVCSRRQYTLHTDRPRGRPLQQPSVPWSRVTTRVSRTPVDLVGSPAAARARTAVRRTRTRWREDFGWTTTHGTPPSSWL